MSTAYVHVMGRLTKDPVMQQGKNSGIEYMNLDLAVTQKNQEGNKETVYYQCYLNSFLAQRILNAGVHKGTAIIVIGDLELGAFVYQQGAKAGQAGISAKVNTKDWIFPLSNKQEDNSSTNSGPTTNGYNGQGRQSSQSGRNYPPRNNSGNGGYTAAQQQNNYRNNHNNQASMQGNPRYYNQNNYPANNYQQSPNYQQNEMQCEPPQLPYN